MKSKLITAAVLVTLLTFAGLVGHIVYLRHQRAVAAAAQAAVELELAGFRSAVTSTPKEVIAAVPTLVTPEVKKAVKAGVVIPITSAKIEAHKTVEVLIPPTLLKEEALDFNSVSVPPTDLSLSAGQPAEADNPRIPLHLTFSANLLVTRIKFGIATQVAADAGGSVAVGEAKPQFFRFEEDEATFEVRFSDEISKILSDHDKRGGFYKRHFRFTFPAITVGYNVLDPSKPIVTSVGASWGYVW